ncbi:hypothetical protein L1987_01924 [Smallanthus sonchifolius]|uniref:Uncharacterized protein n=1 Tax=Smallanthus sonchifolius TaxID=185202 RepID=A0ACB9K6D7_9ASTR|nr:hypothetical protein L1987_01924 [Smallanthus sonchifolius]
MNYVVLSFSASSAFHQRHDGFRLTYLGYDFLAIKTTVNRGVFSSVGRQIGVGEEFGRTSFRVGFRNGSDGSGLGGPVDHVVMISKEQVDALSSELHSRATIPNHVYKAIDVLLITAHPALQIVNNIVSLPEDINPCSKTLLRGFSAKDQSTKGEHARPIFDFPSSEQ